MIKVSVLYPNRAGSKFDMSYYLGTHIKLVKDKLGTALQGVHVDSGMSGAAPDSEPDYVAMGHLLFNSVGDFQAAFGPHAEAIMGDIPNYTDIEPQVVVSEIKC